MTSQLFTPTIIVGLKGESHINCHVLTFLAPPPLAKECPVWGLSELDIWEFELARGEMNDNAAIVINIVRFCVVKTYLGLHYKD